MYFIFCVRYQYESSIAILAYWMIIWLLMSLLLAGFFKLIRQIIPSEHKITSFLLFPFSFLSFYPHLIFLIFPHLFFKILLCILLFSLFSDYLSLSFLIYFPSSPPLPSYHFVYQLSSLHPSSRSSIYHFFILLFQPPCLFSVFQITFS